MGFDIPKTKWMGVWSLRLQTPSILFLVYFLNRKLQNLILLTNPSYLMCHITTCLSTVQAGGLVQCVYRLTLRNSTKSLVLFYWEYFYFLIQCWLLLTLPTKLSAEPTTSGKLGLLSAGLPGREWESRSLAKLPFDSPGLLPAT